MRKISDDSYNNASKDDLILMLIDNQNDIIDWIKEVKNDKRTTTNQEKRK